MGWAQNGTAIGEATTEGGAPPRHHWCMVLRCEATTGTTAVAMTRKRHRNGGVSFTEKLKKEETKCEKSQEKSQHHHVQISTKTMELAYKTNDKATRKKRGKRKEDKNLEEEERKEKKSMRENEGIRKLPCP